METIELFLKQHNLVYKSTSEQKKYLRKYLIQRRKKELELEPKQSEWGKKQFFKALSILNLESQNELENKFRIACFFPIHAELNFLPYARKNWLFPKMLGQKLVWFEYGDGLSHYTLNRFKIPEKQDEYCFEYKAENKPLVCFVPGLAGDSQRYRLGYGKGYYDKFLEKHPNVVSILCLPSDHFLFDKLPTDTHDTQVTHIIV